MFKNVYNLIILSLSTLKKKKKTSNPETMMHTPLVDLIWNALKLKFLCYGLILLYILFSHITWYETNSLTRTYAVSPNTVRYCLPFLHTLFNPCQSDLEYCSWKGHTCIVAKDNLCTLACKH